MKRLYLTLCISLLTGALPSLFATQPDFDIGVSFGIKSGTINELLMETDGTLVSKLTWNQQFSPTIGAHASVSLHHFSLTGSVLMAVPTQTGTMQDYDYQSDGTTIAYFSSHENHLLKDFTTTLKASGDIPLEMVTVTPFFAYTWQNRMFAAVNGYTQYPSSGFWTENDPKTYLTGIGLTYEQWLSFPEIGMQVTRQLTHPAMTVYFLGSWYPYMTITAMDHHFLRSLLFTDEMTGYGGKATIGAQWEKAFHGTTDVRVEISYEGIHAEGNTYEQYIGENSVKTLLAGYQGGTTTSLFSLMISFAF